MNKELLWANLRNVPDFPIPGIQFKDVSTLFKNAECMREMTDEMVRIYKDAGITKVVLSWEQYWLRNWARAL